ncbi:MAG: hypothetical protein M3Q97_00380 [Bacteroidota bacterium]|nr:hypothetical protein [Bacteroidota bacterium]
MKKNSSRSQHPRKFWTKIILVNFIPVILLHVAVIPLRKSNDNVNFAHMIEFLGNMVLLPIPLLIYNYVECLKKPSRWFLYTGIILISAILAGKFLHIRNWATYTGTWKLDDGTLENFAFFILADILVCASGTWFGYNSLRKRRQSEGGRKS